MTPYSFPLMVKAWWTGKNPPDIFQNTQIHQVRQKESKETYRAALRVPQWMVTQCSLSSFPVPLKSYEKLHSNKGFQFHFIMRNNVESNSPLIFLKYMGTPVATPPEIHFYFFLIKPPNQPNPGWILAQWLPNDSTAKRLGKQRVPGIY